jgi:hypothetical protein
MAPMKTSAISLLALALIVPSACAETIWKGDFETGGLDAWKGGAAIAKYAMVVADPVREGRHALRIDGSNAARRRDHDRIELQHQPRHPGTAEGTERYFGWSFYLPAKLTPGHHSLGYFETRNSWTRLMAFEAKGEDIQFSTRVPYALRWVGKGRLTTGRWHDIAVRVIWSRDPEKGLVEVWFDGERVVDPAKTATLRDENEAFLQVGLFRETHPVPETLFIDHIVEATTLAEVMPPALKEARPAK